MNGIRSSALVFPPGLVDGSGRRLRPSMMVAYQGDDGASGLLAEVLEWRREGLVLLGVDADGDGNLIVRQPSEVLVVDSSDVDRVTMGEFIVESPSVPTVVVQGVGARDLVPREPDSRSVRQWSTELAEHLASVNESERNRILGDYTAPLLERVLQEAVLPRIVDRLVLVCTDQEEAHPLDTVHVARVLRYWLESRGHVVGVGEPDPGRRWIRNIEIWPIHRVPHIVEAVAFAMRSEMPKWLDGAGRVVVVHGGGTPAMNMAALMAAVVHKTVSIRVVQVPDTHAGTGRRQPVIEADLTDLPTMGDALGVRGDS